MNRQLLFLICLPVALATYLSSFATAQQNPSLGWVTSAPIPRWVWDAEGSSNRQTIFLRKDVTLASPIKSARLYTTCDNQMTLWINGSEVGSSPDWPKPIIKDVTENLTVGNNTIAVRAQNAGGVAAFIFKLVIDHRDGKQTVVMSNPTWKMANEPPSDDWKTSSINPVEWTGKLKSLNRLGATPWGVPGDTSRNASASVTDPKEISVPDGFIVELVHTVDSNEHGSWVSLTTMPDGRLVACDQGNKGACFVRVVVSDGGPQAELDTIDVSEPGSSRRLSGAQGLLWAFDSLWFHRNGGHLYRIRDTDGDGRPDSATEIPSQTGGGEHGNHAVILTEDGAGIYMDGGNHAPLSELASSRVTTWDEDLLLPRMWDANGHARGRLAPGGWVTRLDPETLEQELVCIGFRNQYDIALNRYGDLFTYDADMEWDLGSPWYRPTRICQVVSGGDYGWRSGTGKWPTYYEDSLPPVVDIGPGSPTGVVAGLGAKFPARYQDAIYGLDWTFGTIYAIHLEPRGASYVGRSEPFVTGSPLPVTDAVVGSDGALYFTIGGRGTQSALYRVRYQGDESTAPSKGQTFSDEVRQARAARKQLEAYHGKRLGEEESKGVIEMAWPHLSSEDRFLRAAARVAIESQPTELWAERVFEESSPQARITAAVALARVGKPEHKGPLLHSLGQLDPDSLSKSQLLGWLRAVALTFIRLGEPDAGERQQWISRLDPLLPRKDGDVNTELVRMLVYLKSPTIIEKTLALITDRGEPEIPDWSELAKRNERYGRTVQSVLDNHPPSREIGYALMLRNLAEGWTLAQRRTYFEFLNQAAKASGGASFPGFLRNIREEALGQCSDEQRRALEEITGEDFNPIPDFEIKPIEGPGQRWTLDSARRHTNFRQANFENGRSLYFAANCGKCHRFAGLGGNVGPDLTSIRNKFDINYVIEHVIDPDKIISDQYQSSVVLTSDGRSLTGLMSEADGEVIIYPADVKADPIKLDSDEIEAVKPSPISQMPKGLFDPLSGDELRDLLAYLMSGGDPSDRRVYGR